jgi:hypothetical protein
MLYKNQSRDAVNEHTKFDNTRNTTQGGKTGRGQDVKSIMRDLDPRIDARLLEVIEKLVDKFVVYSNIYNRLKNHFFTLGEPLPYYV